MRTDFTLQEFFTCGINDQLWELEDFHARRSRQARQADYQPIIWPDGGAKRNFARWWRGRNAKFGVNKKGEKLEPWNVRLNYVAHYLDFMTVCFTDSVTFILKKTGFSRKFGFDWSNENGRKSNDVSQTNHTGKCAKGYSEPPANITV